MSLVARDLEAHGIATVIIGSAKDIVEYCGVPRFLFSDFPLGNPAGPPFEPALQDRTLRQAVDLLKDAKTPRSTLKSSVHWTGDADWRPVYNRLTPENRKELAAIGEARRLEQDRLRAK